MLVSVIIPTYKRPNLILKTLSSAFNQTYSPIEIIVVDDNGKDTNEQIATRKILEPFLLTEKIKYIAHEHNSGANVARNTGFHNSSGDLIAFLDDDDEWLPTKIEKQVELALSDEAIGVVYTVMRIIYDDFGLSYRTFPHKGGDLSDLLLIENYVGAMSSVLIRRASLTQNPLDVSLPARQDYDLWIRVSKKWRFALADEVLTIAYARASSSRITCNIDNYFSAVEAINLKYKSDISMLSPSEHRIRESEQCFFLASQAIKANRPRIARKYFLKAFTMRPNIKSLFSFFVSLFGTRGTIFARVIFSKLKETKRELKE